jgi:hypothetical protein
MVAGDGWFSFVAMAAVIGSSSLCIIMTRVFFSIPTPACRVFSIMVPPLYHSSTSSRCRMRCSIGCIFAELVVFRQMTIVLRWCSLMATAMSSNTAVMLAVVSSSGNYARSQLISSWLLARLDVSAWSIGLLSPSRRTGWVLIRCSTWPWMPVFEIPSSRLGGMLIVHTVRSVETD